jgi:hypothetical protein
LLADSVDIIILIPESPGSFAELGAFANNDKLREKIICIVDKRYQKHKSFINLGPLKLIKKSGKDRVVYIDTNDLDSHMKTIHKLIKKLKKNIKKDKSKITLLELESFLLPVIYLLEPIDKKNLIRLVEVSSKEVSNIAFQTTTAALTLLTKKKYINLTTEGYKLTEAGKNEFLKNQESKGRNKKKKERDTLDEVNLELMSNKYRNKKLKIS